VSTLNTLIAMNKHQKTELVKPELVDAENPEWTAETLAKARPAS
jgi:hypothetical protein